MISHIRCSCKSRIYILFALLFGCKCEAFGLITFVNNFPSFFHPYRSGKFIYQRCGSEVRCTLGRPETISTPSTPDNKGFINSQSLLVYNFMSPVDYGDALNIQKQIQAERIQLKTSDRSEVNLYIIDLK
jgi:hypothetical protein